MLSFLVAAVKVVSNQKEDNVQNLTSLLKPGELTVPEEVVRCADFLRNLGIWHLIGRNDKVGSCHDAARRRTRLGHSGIPLSSELKTFAGVYTNKWDQQRVFLAHCRADRELDMERVRKSLFYATEVRRANPEELEMALGSVYGTVNPFVAGIEQLFDNELSRKIGYPGTMMTNAGNHTWAAEFYARELATTLGNFGSFRNIIQKNIAPAIFAGFGPREPKTIGILTGNPGLSGSDLQRAVIHHAKILLGANSAGDVSMPRLILLSEPDVGMSMELTERQEPLSKLMVSLVNKLIRSYRCGIVSHPAHTTSFFSPEMSMAAQNAFGKFISLPEATIAKVRKLGITEVALLGTEYVAGLGPFSAYRDAFEGIKVHKPSAEGFDTIKRLGYEIQKNGITPRCRNWMRDLLQREVPQGCQHVLLLMTEFTPLLQALSQKEHLGKVLIDPMDSYGEAVAKEWFYS